jgi:hypothetical protein
MRAPRERTRLVRRVEKSTAHGVRAEINKRGKVRMSDLRCRSESDPLYQEYPSGRDARDVATRRMLPDDRSGSHRDESGGFRR